MHIPSRSLVPLSGLRSTIGTSTGDEMSNDPLKQADVEKIDITRAEDYDPDAEFGGHEARRRLERRLLWKVDRRMSILVLIYILNYVR